MSKLFRRNTDSVMPKTAESADEKVKGDLKVAVHRVTSHRVRMHTVSGALPCAYA